MYETAQQRIEQLNSREASNPYKENPDLLVEDIQELTAEGIDQEVDIEALVGFLGSVESQVEADLMAEIVPFCTEIHNPNTVTYFSRCLELASVQRTFESGNPGMQLAKESPLARIAAFYVQRCCVFMEEAMSQQYNGHEHGYILPIHNLYSSAWVGYNEHTIAITKDLLILLEIQHPDAIEEYKEISLQTRDFAIEEFLMSTATLYYEIVELTEALNGKAKIHKGQPKKPKDIPKKYFESKVPAEITGTRRDREIRLLRNSTNGVSETLFQILENSDIDIERIEEILRNDKLDPDVKQLRVLEILLEESRYARVILFQRYCNTIQTSQLLTVGLWMHNNFDSEERAKSQDYAKLSPARLLVNIFNYNPNRPNCLYQHIRAFMPRSARMTNPHKPKSVPSEETRRNALIALKEDSENPTISVYQRMIPGYEPINEHLETLLTAMAPETPYLSIGERFKLQREVDKYKIAIRKQGVVPISVAGNIFRYSVDTSVDQPKEVNQLLQQRGVQAIEIQYINPYRRTAQNETYSIRITLNNEFGSGTYIFYMDQDAEIYFNKAGASQPSQIERITSDIALTNFLKRFILIHIASIRLLPKNQANPEEKGAVGESDLKQATHKAFVLPEQEKHKSHYFARMPIKGPRPVYSLDNNHFHSFVEKQVRKGYPIRTTDGLVAFGKDDPISRETIDELAEALFENAKAYIYQNQSAPLIKGLYRETDGEIIIIDSLVFRLILAEEQITLEHFKSVDENFGIAQHTSLDRDLTPAQQSEIRMTQLALKNLHSMDRTKPEESVLVMHRI